MSGPPAHPVRYDDWESSGMPAKTRGTERFDVKQPAKGIEEILTRHKKQAGVSLDYELSVEQLRDIIADFKVAIRQAAN